MINGEGGHDQATEYLLNRVRRIRDNPDFSSIYVVPNILTEVNYSSFTPRVVSIGPLHKGRTNLKSVESKKPKDLKELLENCMPNQVALQEDIVKNCVQKVRGSIQEIRACYFGMRTYTDNIVHNVPNAPLMNQNVGLIHPNVPTANHNAQDAADVGLMNQNVPLIGLRNYSDREVVQIMVMDACFILHFIDNLGTTDDNRFSNNRLRSRNIALDLVLLENQIPFFVLQDIYDLTLRILRPQSTLITMLSDNLLKLVNPFSESLRVENVGTETPYHILGLLHKFYKPNFAEPIIEEIPTAHSAVDLDQFGVKIRLNKELTWPMAMELKYSFFFHRPTLRMPIVRIDKAFEVVLRNLIAYEQYSPVDNYATSYAMAMHMLGATPADIDKLVKAGVINVSHLGSKENASDMIRRICQNVTLQDFYYIEPWKNIAQYCDNYWLRNYGVLKRTYFDTPWKVLAVFAAVIVFLITVVQFFRQVVFKPFS